MKPVAIAAIGMITPSAGDSKGSVGCMVVEARRFDPLASIDCLTLVGAKTPIADEVTGLDRLVQLGSHALWEAVDAETAAGRICLVVCAPAETDEPALAGQGPTLLARLATEAELNLAPLASRVCAMGHGAIFEALPLALAALTRNDVTAVCLLGVDSLVTRPRLRQLLERAGATVAAPPPGEAAAAVVLTRRADPNTLAMLLGVGVNNERFLHCGVASHPGKGLIAAIERAAAEAELCRPSYSILTHDMTGAARDVEELTWARTASAFIASPSLETVSPYVSIGDAGAAMGVLALATSAFLAHKATSPALGLCCLSAAGRRCAAILSRGATVAHSTGSSSR